jgi:hypothetical protein
MRWLGRNRAAVTSNRQFLGERRWKEEEGSRRCMRKREWRLQEEWAERRRAGKP